MKVSFCTIFLSAFLCLCFTLPAVANDKAKKEKQLKTLQKKITTLQETIEVKQNSKSTYIKQLKQIEKNIGRISQAIKISNKKITSKKIELKQLHKAKKKSQKQLTQENAALAQQVYSAYTLGKQEKAKLLFSQPDVGYLQRDLIYYQYFLNARVDLIKNVQTSIDSILKIEADINKAKISIEASQQNLQNQKSLLVKDGKKRQTMIASLDKQLKSQGGVLGKLQGDADELQSLINSIEEIFTESPEPIFERKPFAKLKGKLAWPVKGEVKKLFGRQKQLSELRWQGILIEASTGHHVRAISRGRVAFADWLRGLGNIIIIDHGHSYLSLYGHNEALFKSAGEWVEAGDIISSIGSSGGQKKSALYFEIRKKGKPQNPARWCKNENHFSSKG